MIPHFTFNTHIIALYSFILDDQLIIICQSLYFADDPYILYRCCRLGPDGKLLLEVYDIEHVEPSEILSL